MVRYTLRTLRSQANMKHKEKETSGNKKSILQNTGVVSPRLQPIIIFKTKWGNDSLLLGGRGKRDKRWVGRLSKEKDD